MKLGTATGFLVNHLYANSKYPAPEIGMGATILMWTDRHAATVTWIHKKGKQLKVVRDNAKVIGKGGPGSDPSYEYSPGNGSEILFKLRKNGEWIQAGTRNGDRLALGFRREYYDWSF